MPNVSIAEVWPGLNFSWVPTNVSDLHLTNCTSASVWQANIFNTADLNSVDIPVLSAVQILDESLQDWLKLHNFDEPKDQELYAYIYYDFIYNDAPFLGSVYDYALESCLPELCPLLRWQGNSDLAGRGMLVNYILQAVLATFYFGLLAALRLRWISSNERDRSITRRGILAVQHSARTFLDAAIFFCMAMLLAALYTFARGYAHSSDFLTNYGSVTTAFLSLYSIIPAIIIHACISDQLRRKYWRIASWTLIISLSIIVAVLYLYLPHVANHMSESQVEKIIYGNTDLQFFWDIICLNEKGLKQMDLSTKVLIGALFGTTLLYVVFRLISKCSKHVKDSRLRNSWWIFTALFSILGMWTCLGLFIYLRRVMNQGSGKSNKDHEWSFGQVLGLVTWAPVVIDMAHIWWYGPKEGYSGQMVGSYSAIQNSDLRAHGDSLTELVPRGYQPVHRS